MNAERLLALYEKVAEAPDAVPRLRRFVLDLAVRGKLVPQDAGDVSPVVLLAEARKQLKAQAETAKRMRWKQTDVVSADEIDKDVPSGWVAARVNDTGLYINGLAFKPADWKQSGIPIIRIQNLTDPQKEFNYAQGDFPDEVMVREGDLLVSWSATLEAFKWDRDEGVLNQHIFRVIPYEGLTDRGFLLLLLRHAIREMADSEHAHGLVMTHINRGPFLNHVVLIPPLAEQRRIVAKVEELMALLDRLEAARGQREATRDRLTAASLARLTAPDADVADFPTNARFALATLPALTTRPDQIKPLRQTILNLAVRGKLVEQDATDEPASDELKKVVKLKADQNLRKPKKIATVADEEKWCLTPVGWCWTRWDQITNWITYGFTRPMEHVETGVPIVTGKNVNEGQIIFETASLTPATLFDALNDKDKPQPGDILITKDGSIGRTAIVEEKHLPFCIKQSVAVMWLRSCHFDRRFLKLVLDSPQTQDALQEKTAGVAIKHISITDLGKMVFPLPPLAEQHRIVAKVDALMALCDRLDAALTTADTTRARFLEALLHEALAPAAKAVTEAAE